MKDPNATSGKSNADENRVDAHLRHKGLVVFCETNLRYEKGFKAWIFLGPYLLGALGLEVVISERAQTATEFAPWLGFLAYLILFPLAWRRILNLFALRKAPPDASLR